MPQNISPVLLRNRGVPVEVARLVPDETGSLAPILDEEGNPQTEQRWVRVTNNVLVAIEETWGDFGVFGEHSKEKPASTIRKFLSIVWNEPEHVTGERMLMGHLDQYAGAVGAAIMISQGVDPTVAATMLETGVKLTTTTSAAATAEAAKMLAEVNGRLDKAAEQIGQDGGPGGSESD